ncbi:MAG: efflux RND transporter periplasmic adaptor subunit, partial [Pseudomonadota bacterium]
SPTSHSAITSLFHGRLRQDCDDAPWGIGLKLGAEPGAILAEGDPVARLDARLIELEIKDNESIIRQLTAQLRFESRQYDRMKELAARNNAPAQRLDETLSARDVTEQQLAQARNALARSELQLERSVIRAPFPGRVVERLIQVGEFANTGLEIARLVDTTHTEIRAQAPLSVARYVKPGDPVRIEYDGTSEITQVRAIIPVGDEVSRSLEVRVLSTPNVAIIGSAVRVQLANAEPREVIAIPRDALIIRRTGVFAFKVGGEDKAERIVITIGVSDGEWVEALGPLTAGDRMVVRGGERLRPGQKLVINGES